LTAEAIASTVVAASIGAVTVSTPESRGLAMRDIAALNAAETASPSTSLDASNGRTRSGRVASRTASRAKPSKQ
jgi:hypothetical protein